MLFEARDERNPLLERVKFLTIVAGKLDEFFQMRISGLRQQVHAGSTSPLARRPKRRRAARASRQRVLQLVTSCTASTEVRRALADEGIEIVDYNAIPDHHRRSGSGSSTRSTRS